MKHTNVLVLLGLVAVAFMGCEKQGTVSSEDGMIRVFNTHFTQFEDVTNYGLKLPRKYEIATWESDDDVITTNIDIEAKGLRRSLALYHAANLQRITNYRDNVAPLACFAFYYSQGSEYGIMYFKNEEDQKHWGKLVEEPLEVAKRHISEKICRRIQNHWYVYRYPAS